MNYLINRKDKNMESTEIYKKSYDNITKAQRAVCTDELLIKFSEFDTETAGVLRKTITEIHNKRKKEIQQVIFRAE